jgi:hypothetical protein
MTLAGPRPHWRPLGNTVPVLFPVCKRPTRTNKISMFVSPPVQRGVEVPVSVTGPVPITYFLPPTVVRTRKQKKQKNFGLSPLPAVKLSPPRVQLPTTYFRGPRQTRKRYIKSPARPITSAGTRAMGPTPVPSQPPHGSPAVPPVASFDQSRENKGKLRGFFLPAPRGPRFADGMKQDPPRPRQSIRPPGRRPPGGFFFFFFFPSPPGKK